MELLYPDTSGFMHCFPSRALGLAQLKGPKEAEVISCFDGKELSDWGGGRGAQKKGERAPSEFRCTTRITCSLSRPTSLCLAKTWRRKKGVET